MILRIARKEFSEMTRDGRFRTVAAIVLALLVAALAIGWRHYREVKADRDAAQAQAYDQWLNQGRRNPHSAAHYGTYAFKPMLPLALVDRGVEAYTGAAVFLEAHKQNEFRLRPATNAVTLAAVWLALVIIVPALLAVFVAWRHSVPSRLAFINAARETAARTKELLADFFAAHPELKPAKLDKNDFMSGFYAAQFDRDKRLVPLAASYETQLQRQNDLAAQLRFLSPALVMQLALNDLAGAGFDRYARFVAQVHAFHREWRRRTSTRWTRAATSLRMFRPSQLRRARRGADVAVFRAGHAPARRRESAPIAVRLEADILK